MKNLAGGFLLILITNSGCSTMNNKTLASGLIGFLSCSAIGAISAPKDEKPEMHGLLWGSVCSSASMLGAELLDTKRKSKYQKSKLLNLRSEDSIEELKIKNSILNSQEYSRLDIETKNKLNGKWSIYKTDNWFMEGEKLKHENLEIEFE
jgi:hypothetical protein